MGRRRPGGAAGRPPAPWSEPLRTFGFNNEVRAGPPFGRLRGDAGLRRVAFPSREEALLADEARWARRLRDGDRAALEEAFRAYYAPLCSFVRQQVGSLDTAEELVQDVFLHVWQRRAQLDPDGSLHALLYRSAHNAALNHLKHLAIERRWARAVAAAPEPVGAGADAGVRERELSGAIRDAVAALPERCRLVFLMSRQQGLGYAEIAEVLDLSVKTVETQMGRALKSLRSALAAFVP